MTKAERAKNRRLWESRVAAFKASGQSAAKWCADQDVKVHQLRYWIRKCRPENEPAKKPMKWLSVGISELESDKPQEALPVRVGKATIEVRPGFNPKLLSEVVKALSML